LAIVSTSGSSGMLDYYLSPQWPWRAIYSQ
jgi:hypothetical protein